MGRLFGAKKKSGQAILKNALRHGRDVLTMTETDEQRRGQSPEEHAQPSGSGGSGSGGREGGGSGGDKEVRLSFRSFSFLLCGRFCASNPPKTQARAHVCCSMTASHRARSCRATEMILTQLRFNPPSMLRRRAAAAQMGTSLSGTTPQPASAVASGKISNARGEFQLGGRGGLLLARMPRPFHGHKGGCFSHALVLLRSARRVDYCPYTPEPPQPWTR